MLENFSAQTHVSHADKIVSMKDRKNSVSKHCLYSFQIRYDGIPHTWKKCIDLPFVWLSLIHFFSF